MTLGGLFALSRPGNALLSAVGVAVGALAAAPDALGVHATAVALTAAAALLGTAGGNALNDVHDAALDRRAHPSRPIPSGAVGRTTAAGFAAGAWLLALGFAWAVSTLVLLLAAACILVLVAYEHDLKSRGLVGNAAVGLVAGALFPLGGLAVMGAMTAPLLLGGTAALAHVGRELLKDAEDATHDQATRRTFAVRHGTRAAGATGAAMLVLAVLVAPLPHWLAGWSDLFLLALLPAVLLFLAAAATGPTRPARARALAKGAMVLALAAFLVGALA